MTASRPTTEAAGEPLKEVQGKILEVVSDGLYRVLAVNGYGDDGEVFDQVRVQGSVDVQFYPGDHVWLWFATREAWPVIKTQAVTLDSFSAFQSVWEYWGGLLTE